jgi:hypothetical protein
VDAVIPFCTREGALGLTRLEDSQRAEPLSSPQSSVVVAQLSNLRGSGCRSRRDLPGW